MTPKYQHDCDNCEFFGRAKYQGKECDFYLCGKTLTDGRSVIARYGSDGPEYSSGPLVGCMGLTRLDWFVLARGIELTNDEKDKLIKILLYSRRDRFNLKEFVDHGLSVPEEEETMFGKESWMSV